ncbi:MAG: ABC-2 transporter permease [Elusimicrobia bacterium]|nr:ABC-2 transporter permease [Elusimicrobiota bacterium]
MRQSLFQSNAVKTLALRGLRGYFETPSAYVALFVFYLLAGYLFAFPLFLLGQASIKSLMDFAPLLLSFLIPALTMGLISEEIKSGTFETLATLPLQDWDIVLGKYLGFAGLALTAVGGLLFFPLALSALVQPQSGVDWGESLGILAGLAWLSLMYGAAGLFASSLTKNQIVAFVSSFMISFFFFVCGKFAGLLPGPLGGLAEFVGVDSHLSNMAKGVLDTRDLLYFLSVIAAFLYLTVERLQARRF